MPRGSDDDLTKRALLRILALVQHALQDPALDDEVAEIRALIERIDAPRGRGIEAVTTEG